MFVTRSGHKHLASATFSAYCAPVSDWVTLDPPRWSARTAAWDEHRPLRRTRQSRSGGMSGREPPERRRARPGAPPSQVPQTRSAASSGLQGRAPRLAERPIKVAANEVRQTRSGRDRQLRSGRHRAGNVRLGTTHLPQVDPAPPTTPARQFHRVHMPSAATLAGALAREHVSALARGAVAGARGHGHHRSKRRRDRKPFRAGAERGMSRPSGTDERRRAASPRYLATRNATRRHIPCPASDLSATRTARDSPHRGSLPPCTLGRILGIP